MMFTRPPGLPIIGEGGVTLMSMGSWMATWSPKLSRTILFEIEASFHSMRNAIHVPLCTARTFSSVTAGVALCGNVTLCGSIATFSARAPAQCLPNASLIGPAPGIRAAVIVVAGTAADAGFFGWATTGPAAAVSTSAAMMSSFMVASRDVGAIRLVLDVVDLADHGWLTERHA